MAGRIGYSAQLHDLKLIDPIDFKGFSRTMSEREDEHFDIDDEFLGEAEESHDFDPLMERTERRPKAAAAANAARRPGAVWRTYSPSASWKKSCATYSKTTRRGTLIRVAVAAANGTAGGPGN